MKKLSLFLLLTVSVNTVFSQSAVDSRNGYRLPTKGVWRIFVVFAEVTGDPNYNRVMADWPAGQMPNNPGSYIDLNVSTNYQSYISRYHDEISFGELKVIGDYHPHLIQIPYSSFMYDYQSYDRVFRKLSELCNGHQIQTARGLNFPNDFDLWTISSSDGHVKTQIPDGAIDCIVICWRINSRMTTTLGSGNFSLLGDTLTIANKTKISTFGRVYTEDLIVFVHEIAHGFLGPNEFHSGGAGAGIGTYMQNYSGYGMLSSDNRYMFGYNAWDRYRLGWKNPQHQYEISARNENQQEVNTDLDYILQTSDSVTYILRDFASTGDAVRIKLPYVRTLNPLAREQWIWITNHQLLSGKIEHQEYKHGQNSPMFKVPRGIYLNLQVGNNNFSSFDSRTNYMAPINKFGKFDFTAYSPSTNVVGDPVTMGETNNAHANPFTGVGLESYHPYDINGDNIIYNKEHYVLGKTKYNGVELGREYFGWLQSSVHGSVYDAYYQGDNISISTNPAIIPFYTYRCTNRLGTSQSPYLTPATDDNRKIYLNGLSIHVVEQRANGDVKISVRWNDYDVKNNVRWCGDIVLNEKVNLLSGATILLDHGLTPTRPVNPITFNNKNIFADPTIFTCKQHSLLKANSGSAIHLKNNSALVAESGSEIELDGANLIIESGSTLHIKLGATLRIKNSGNMLVKSDGYLCVEQGANVILQDYNSVIKMEQNATYGANPAYLTNANCSSAITYSGNGSVIDISQDVYIQNETILSNRYIGGRNIYVGRNVTTSKPQGDVIINNNANVIFDATGDVVFDAGFECALGVTLEVK